MKSVRLRSRLLIASVLAPLAALANPPDKTPPAASDVDAELLEFLGSIDSESAADADKDWLDFLRATDLTKVAKLTPPAAADKGKRK